MIINVNAYLIQLNKMVQPTANTELTIAFIRIIETVMCLLCLITHIHSLNEEEQMPHIVLFCGTFGGFFILSSAKLLVPISGQLSPPGVDLVFSFLGFILFYSAACAAMFYVQSDPHLVAKNGQATLVNEETHPFFRRCVSHATLSITTGTLFLMHAVISADRLTNILKGIEEDVEREIGEDDVDIHPNDTISLHLFFLNWLIIIWNTACCKSIQKLGRKCKMCCIQYYRKRRPPSNVPSRRLHRRAKLLRATEFKRVNGITVSSITPHEFIRNPRRTLAHDNMLSFVENGSFVNRPRSLNYEETPEQGPSSQPQNELVSGKRIAKTVVWSVNEDEANYKSTFDDNKSDDASQVSSGTSVWESQAALVRNKDFGSDEDLPTVKRKEKMKSKTKERHVVPFNESEEMSSFSRNEEFDGDDDISSTNIIWRVKKSFKTVYDSENLDDLTSSISRKRSVSFIRNVDFGLSVQDITKEPSIKEQSQSKSPLKTLAKKITTRRQISYVRNKAFGGSEGESKLRKLFRWFPRKAESVVQDIDANVMRSMESFTEKETPEEPIENQASSEVELSTFGVGDKPMDGQKRARPQIGLEIPIAAKQETPQSLNSPLPIEMDIPTFQNQETPIAKIFATSSSFPSNTQPIAENSKTPKSLTFAASNTYPNTQVEIQKTPKSLKFSPPDFYSKTKNDIPTFKNQESPKSKIFADSDSYNYDVPSDTSTPKLVPENLNKLISDKSMLPASESMAYLTQIPEYITQNKITAENKVCKEPPNLPTPNLIPYILTSTINKGFKFTLDQEFAETEQERKATFPALDSASYMKEIAGLIPSDKVSEITETTDPKYTSTSYTKEDIISSRKSSADISEIMIEEITYGSCCSELDSNSYLKQVAIPSNEMPPSTSKQETKNPTFPALDSSSYIQEVTRLIPSNTSENQTRVTEYCSPFPKLNSTSYLQSITGLIPSSKNIDSTTSSEKKQTDDIKNKK